MNIDVERLTKVCAVALAVFLAFVTVSLSSVQADTVKLAYLLIAFCVSGAGVAAIAKIHEQERESV